MLRSTATATSTRGIRARVAGLGLIVAMLATTFVALSGTAEAATVVAKINFQPAGAPTPAGRIAATGAPFDAATGFGWTKYNGDGTPVDMSAAAEHRSIANDARLDTSIALTKHNSQWGRWEYAVADGKYRIAVTVGDVGATGVRQRLAIENVQFVNWTNAPGKRTRTFGMDVVVTDGRLTYTAPGAARTALVATTIKRLGDASGTSSQQTNTTQAQQSTTTQPAPSSSPAPQPVAGNSNGTIAGFAPGGHFPGQNISEIEKQLDYMASSGAQWLRMPFLWTGFERTKGKFNFAKHDQIVDLANRRGIRIIANLSYTPAWARMSACSTSMFCAPANPNDYANYVEQTVAHFLPRGVEHFELWNEPNMRVFFQPNPDIDKYTRMVKATYSRVKPKYPKATILAGSFAPARDLKNGSQIRSTTFLEGMYARGIRGNFDALTYHPYNYPAAPEVKASYHSFSGVVPQLQDILRRNGDGHKTDIWGTEFAYHTATDSTGVTEQVQADYIGRSYTEWKKISNAPLIWYSLNDRGTDRHDREDNFGLLYKDFSPKPAWNAWKQTMRQAR